MSEKNKKKKKKQPKIQQTRDLKQTFHFPSMERKKKKKNL